MHIDNSTATWKSDVYLYEDSAKKFAETGYLQ